MGRRRAGRRVAALTLALACWSGLATGCSAHQGHAVADAPRALYMQAVAFEAQGDPVAAAQLLCRASAAWPPDPWSVLATLRFEQTRAALAEAAVGLRHAGASPGATRSAARSPIHPSRTLALDPCAPARR